MPALTNEADTPGEPSALAALVDEGLVNRGPGRCPGYLA
jgi:hypothetical protein